MCRVSRVLLASELEIEYKHAIVFIHKVINLAANGKTALKCHLGFLSFVDLMWPLPLICVREANLAREAN